MSTAARVRGTKFHGLLVKAEGQETLTVMSTYLYLGKPAICVNVRVAV